LTLVGVIVGTGTAGAGIIRIITGGVLRLVALPQEPSWEALWRIVTLVRAQTPTASRNTNPSTLLQGLIWGTTVSDILVPDEDREGAWHMNATHHTWIEMI
jgi:hypothetical protein